MRIYKPAVVTIRVTVSRGDQKERFTVIECELDELFTLFLDELKGFTERLAGQRIADGVKIHLRERDGNVNIGERTVNIYGISTDSVVERLESAINMAESNKY